MSFGIRGYYPSFSDGVRALNEGQTWWSVERFLRP
jgi:hypothetical protein